MHDPSEPVRNRCGRCKKPLHASRWQEGEFVRCASCGESNVFSEVNEHLSLTLHTSEPIRGWVEEPAPVHPENVDPWLDFARAAVQALEHQDFPALGEVLARLMTCRSCGLEFRPIWHLPQKGRGRKKHFELPEHEVRMACPRCDWCIFTIGPAE